jgi:hypothetical protein
VPHVAAPNPDQVPAGSALDERPPAETLHPLLVEFERLEALAARDESGLSGIGVATFSHDMTIGTFAPLM